MTGFSLKLITLSIVVSISWGLCLNSAYGTTYSEQLDFAQDLINKRQYYRAVSELLRFKEQYSVEEHPNSALLPLADALIVRAYLLGLDFEQAMAWADRFLEEPDALSDDLYFYRALAQLEILYPYEQVRIDSAKSSLDSISTDFPFYAQTKELSEALDNVPEDEKLPFVAGLLNVIPGLGSVYTYRYRDAFITLAIVGLLGYSSYEAYQADQLILSITAGSLAVIFYGGSFISAIGSVYKYNDDLRREYIRQEQNRLRLFVSPWGIGMGATF